MIKNIRSSMAGTWHQFDINTDGALDYHSMINALQYYADNEFNYLAQLSCSGELGRECDLSQEYLTYGMLRQCPSLQTQKEWVAITGESRYLRMLVKVVIFTGGTVIRLFCEQPVGQGSIANFLTSIPNCQGVDDDATVSGPQGNRYSANSNAVASISGHNQSQIQYISTVEPRQSQTQYVSSVEAHQPQESLSANHLKQKSSEFQLKDHEMSSNTTTKTSGGKALVFISSLITTILIGITIIVYASVSVPELGVISNYGLIVGFVSVVVVIGCLIWFWISKSVWAGASLVAILSCMLLSGSINSVLSPIGTVFLVLSILLSVECTMSALLLSRQEKSNNLNEVFGLCFVVGTMILVALHLCV